MNKLTLIGALIAFASIGVMQSATADDSSRAGRYDKHANYRVISHREARDHRRANRIRHRELRRHGFSDSRPFSRRLHGGLLHNANSRFGRNFDSYGVNVYFGH